MRKSVSVILALVMLFALCVPSLAAREIQVCLDGTYIEWTDAVPFIDDHGRTMVPLRPIAEALGLEVEWDGNAKEASFGFTTWVGDDFGNGITFLKAIIFPIGSQTAMSILWGVESPSNDLVYKEEEEVHMDTAAVIVGGRTYAPVRYLAENFGVTVGWDGATKTVLLTTEDT